MHGCLSVAIDDSAETSRIEDVRRWISRFAAGRQVVGDLRTCAGAGVVVQELISAFIPTCSRPRSFSPDRGAVVAVSRLMPGYGNSAPPRSRVQCVSVYCAVASHMMPTWARRRQADQRVGAEIISRTTSRLPAA